MNKLEIKMDLEDMLNDVSCLLAEASEDCAVVDCKYPLRKAVDICKTLLYMQKYGMFDTLDDYDKHVTEDIVQDAIIDVMDDLIGYIDTLSETTEHYRDKLQESCK